MIETPYKLLLEAETLNAQLKFNEHASQYLGSEKAVEAIDFTDEPPLKTLMAASVNYVAVTATRSLRDTIKRFIREMKDTLKYDLTRLLVNIGVDSAHCIDRTNMCGFIAMEWDRILNLQNDINKELKIIKNGSMHRLRAEKYSALNAKARMVGANFQRWVKHSEQREITVAEVKEHINRFNRLIASLEVTEKDIQILTNRVDGTALDETSAKNISDLTNIITYAINSYTMIVNELMKSIHPVHRVVTNTIDSLSKVNPKNWYDDDVDIKAMNDALK